MVSLKSMKNKKALILFKPSGAITIAGELTEIQHKFYDGFLYIGRKTLEKDINTKWFEIKLSDLKQLLNRKELGKDNKYLKEQIENLNTIQVKYNVLKKDKLIEGLANLITEEKFITDLKTKEVIVKYNLPNMVKDSLLKNNKNAIFAQVNLIIKKNLKHKYSLILYDIIKDYEKVQIPEMSIKEFRQIFGIENKYPKMPDLRKWVVDSAIKELNNNDKIEFLISYELIKQGKNYTHIKFTAKPKPTKLKLNQQADKIIEGEVKENPDLQELILLLPADLKNRKKIINIVLGSLEKKGKDYTKAQIEYVIERFNNGKIKNAEAYLKKAIEKDYASAEVINLGDVVSDWKQKLIDMKKIYTLNDGREYLMKAIQDCDEEGICDVQFVSTENNEKIEWARVPEEKLKKIIEKK